jgi:hypothetical protein
MTKILSNKSNIDLDYPICRPSLDLDFTQEVLDPRITFSRGSIGTRVNRNRLIETVSANQPRFDFDPVTGECKGLLIEESRTNYIRNNTMVGAVAGTPGTNPTLWLYVSTQSNGLTASVVGTGIENGINYIDYRFNGTTVASPLSCVFGIDFATAATAQTWTNSLYWKLVGGTTTGVNSWQIGVIESTSGGGFVGGAFYTQTPPTSASLITQRPAATRTLSGGATVGQVSMAVAANVSGRTVIDFTIRLGMPQMEQGSFVTSVIPTVASTVTRSADNAQMTGTNFSSWYNQSEGTLFVVASPSTNGAYSGFIYLLGTDFNNGITYLRQSDYQPVFRIRSGQRDEYSKAINGAVGFGQIWRNAVALKSAISFKTNDFNSFVSGVLITGSRATAGTLPTFTGPLYLGGLNGSTYLNGTISRLTYYPRALKPNQLQYLTQ